MTPPPRTTAAERPAPLPDRTPTSAPLATLDTVSDAVITARVRAALVADPALSGANITVNADRGVVSLTGTVKDLEQAAIASADAQREDGVVRIDDHLALNAQ